MARSGNVPSPTTEKNKSAIQEAEAQSKLHFLTIQSAPFRAVTTTGAGFRRHSAPGQSCLCLLSLSNRLLRHHVQASRQIGPGRCFPLAVCHDTFTHRILSGWPPEGFFQAQSCGFVTHTGRCHMLTPAARTQWFSSCCFKINQTYLDSTCKSAGLRHSRAVGLICQEADSMQLHSVWAEGRSRSTRTRKEWSEWRGQEVRAVLKLLQCHSAGAGVTSDIQSNSWRPFGGLGSHRLDLLLLRLAKSC